MPFPHALQCSSNMLIVYHMAKRKRKPGLVGKRAPNVPRVGKDKTCFLRGAGLDQYNRRSIKISKWHPYECEMLRVLADAYTGGNVSAWIRHASLTFRPKKEDIPSHIDVEDIEYQLECLNPMPF